MNKMLFSLLLLVAFLTVAMAQTTTGQEGQSNNIKQPANERNIEQRDNNKEQGPSSGLTKREQELLDRIDRLEQRLAELEARNGSIPTAGPARPAPTPPMPDMPGMPGMPMPDKKKSPEEGKAEEQSLLAFFRDTTVNVLVDGYYGYNFNRPIGHTNVLRAYDVSSNSFSLNQAALIIERPPDVEAGRRFGLRLDLQYGQATETLQGSSFNELRPQVYRNLWQAYGTYVAPVGKGLTIDFGKFAGMLGYESNYTKDNINYSRSYYFNFLPFYHSGLRFKYPVNDKVTVMYHLVNGANQTEDFNGFKSQHIAVMLMPTKRFMWQLNYYFGREQRELLPDPTTSGQTTITPRGRLQILDTYFSWNATDKLTLAGEADYVINRVETFSPPSRVVGGAAYVRYYFTPKFALAGRAEYLRDNGGLFSGMTQSLKETTVTADYNAAEGFLIRGEWRRDFSNQLFFPTRSTGIFKRDQNTMTVGLIFWLGRKKGVW